MELWQDLKKSFWSTNVWLPPNVTWEDIAPGSRADVQHADYKDLIWPLPLSVLVMLLRYTLERLVTISDFISHLINYVCPLESTVFDLDL